MKRIAIGQSNYIPWKGYFDLIKTVDEFVIYDEVQYTKNYWRNRPTWKRLGEYHLAAAGGFAAWWTVSNFLVLFGTHYLLAALLAIGSSLALGLFTNFRWIWRNRLPATPPAP